MPSCTSGKCLFLMILVTVSAVSSGRFRDLYSDTWVATDALGRELPGYDQVGGPRKNRTVGIFYWTWLTHFARPDRGVFDMTQILLNNPTNPEFGPVGAAHHWGKPEMGYYVGTDPYVLRKHALMLTQAGVDVLFFDTTNSPFTFKESYMALCEVFSAMRNEGHQTPRFVFICPFGNPAAVLDQIYVDLYEPGLYPDLWFYWDGKPLVLANPQHVSDSKMLDFFTFRRPMPTYFDPPSGPKQWGWLHVYPQPVFYGNTPEEVEQITVGVAQNAVDNKLAPMSHKDGAYGRSWHNGRRNPAPNAVIHGFNFQEQFDRALEVDPPFIFITGWNEWVAQRKMRFHGGVSVYTSEEHSYYPEGMFVDQFDQEYSRDIEPMAGGHTDNYYYQMIANIRRYKGVRKPWSASMPKTIRIDGKFEEWNDVEPEFRDAIGDTAHRDHRGFGDTRYINTTGRNDLATMKLTRDADNVYFYAETAKTLTCHTDNNWMLLFIDIDQDHCTGWQGYDYVINLDVRDETTSVHRLRDGWNLEIIARVPYAVNDNRVELAVQRDALGLTADCPVSLDFKWADNPQKCGDITEFFIHGDVAPDRRFNYRLIDKEFKGSDVFLEDKDGK